jgi:hypothetical protein
VLLIGIHSIGIIHVIFKQWFADGLTFNGITCFFKTDYSILATE